MVEEEAITEPLKAQISQNLAVFVAIRSLSIIVGRCRPERPLVTLAKKGHFAKVCIITKRRVNMIQQDEPQQDQSDLIVVAENSEPNYCVMAINVVQINSVDLLKAEGGKPSSLKN